MEKKVELMKSPVNMVKFSRSLRNTLTYTKVWHHGVGGLLSVPFLCFIFAMKLFVRYAVVSLPKNCMQIITEDCQFSMNMKVFTGRSFSVVLVL